MSKYTCYYNLNQTYYRHLANSWKRWADSVSLNVKDREGMARFFRPIAVRFGLIREFREIGVI